jgi:3-hydroxymyristoyl/3-hydroxydecanoyl-(acyl carrier protein) dehydratase
MTKEGAARLRLSVNEAIHRGAGAGAYLPTLLLEILAQAALGVPSEGGGEEERIGYLGGIDNAHFLPVLIEQPLRPGDTLEASVEQRGAFGRTLKVRGELRRGEELLVEADLVLVMMPSPS